jgi:2-polyprenyl-6-methoxyphenol hydroxylase-like FAD-dependent oxidoreductase
MTAAADPSSSTLPVLVIGAGPTGLTLAAELARHGVECRIVDRGDGPTNLSKAIGMQARTLEILDGLGIIDDILDAGHVVHGVSGHVKEKRIFHFSYDELDSPYPFLLNIVQRDTERILGEFVSSLGLTIEWHVEVVGYEQDEDGVVATLQHPDGRQETVHAQWLVGCDGARSFVRQAIGTSFEGDTYTDYFALADARLEWQLTNQELHAFVSPEGVLFALPLGDDHYRLIVADKASADRPEGTQPTFDDFERAIATRGPGGAKVSEPGWMTAFRVNARVAGNHRDGRAFLAGDAAHIHSPVGGQGLNTSVQDAHNLAWKLACVINGHASETLLDSYDAERMPVAHAVITMTNRLTHMLTLHNVEAQHVRNSLMPLLGRVPAIQHQMRDQDAETVVNYRHSPLVDEFSDGHFGIRRHAGGVRPGDRAPDVQPIGLPDGTTGRLFDVMRRATWHTLLIFEGEDPSEDDARCLSELAEYAEQRYPQLVRAFVVSESGGSGLNRITDEEGLLHHRYHADRPSAFLIRPDGYVAFRSRPPTDNAIAQYLDRLFSLHVAEAATA